jgi:Ca2+-transporting ATPase
MLQPRRLGYDFDVARAVAFHCMAIGQLLVTYPSRYPWARPLPNVYLHAAVLGGIGIQLTAAWLRYSAGLLGNASIPLELWGLATVASRFAWQHDAQGGAAR